MNYIVFDLEWNQNPSGKKTRNDRLPFEIIEIGAVKVNSKKEITDHFHRLIKPQVYKWIHDSIHEVIFPPSGVYLIALLIRFTNTCWILRLSPQTASCSI